MTLSGQYYIYLLANRKHGTLYVGMTNDLIRRVYEHKSDCIEGFTKKYAVHRLVYYEVFADPYNAISREKALKSWKREWKIALVEKGNPEWVDLYDSLSGL